MKNIIYILPCLFITACTTTEYKKEKWMTETGNKLPQILLTNTFQFKGRPQGLGASSFLVETKNDTLLVTAKHLLGDDMDIKPEVPLDSVNSLLTYWKAYPRTDTLSADTIRIAALVNNENDKKDFLLFRIQKSIGAILPLKPRFDRPKRGEKLFVIGCENKDTNCNQKLYEAEMDLYEDGKLAILLKTKFETDGFSGAPVIDTNGYAVGIISGMFGFNDNLYLHLEPMRSVEKWVE